MNNNHKNVFFVNLTYTTNFKPSLYKNFDKFKYINKNKINCRNFFLFLFLLKYINNFNFCNNVTLFVKPFKKNFYTILIAPYRNKLSRHQIGFFRYFINFKLIFFVNFLIFKNFDQFFFFLKKFNSFLKFFETNIIYNYKIKIFFNFKILNFIDFKKLN